MERSLAADSNLAYMLGILARNLVSGSMGLGMDLDLGMGMGLGLGMGMGMLEHKVADMVADMVVDNMDRISADISIHMGRSSNHSICYSLLS